LKQEFNLNRPVTITELKEQLSQPGTRILAGGTDIVPQMRQGRFSSPVLIDTSGIKSLNFIEDKGSEILIGALTTHREIADSTLIKNTNSALTAAAESIGCEQTRSRGTLGGNIANASPAGDTLPALLVFQACLLLQKLGGERQLTLEDFIKGPGETDLKPGEFIHSVKYFPLLGKWGCSFLKLGKSEGINLSVVNAAAAVVLDESGVIEDVRLAVGAVAPVVFRCRKTEDYLKGKKATSNVYNKVSDLVQEEINPITDLRSTDTYRNHSAGVVLRRVLENAVVQARGRI
jgi:CO/xanthine dehydrogenase FAD-binding subunit